MVDVREIYGYMAKNGVTKAKLAGMLGISMHALRKRFAEKKFNTDEALVLINNLNIPLDNITGIFFEKERA